MKIYFAGSISGGREHQDIYFQIVEILKNYGAVLTEHVASQDLTQMGESALSAQAVFQRDLNWIKQADILVAEITKPSLGVGYELAYAESLGKPILCLYNTQILKANQKVSSVILGNPYMQVREYRAPLELAAILEAFVSSQTQA